MRRPRKRIYLDYEFQPGDEAGTHPWLVCLVVIEVAEDGTRRINRYRRDELLAMKIAPFDTSEDALVVSYTNAEARCMLTSGWAMPQRSLDLYAEYIVLTNDLQKKVKGARTFLRALRAYGLPAMSDARKNAVRDLILNKRNYTAEEWEEILAYCQDDVEALITLHEAMEQRGHIDWPNALWRGLAMWAFAVIEHEGIPIDADLYRRLRLHLRRLRLMLIERLPPDLNIYEDGVRKYAKMAALIRQHCPDWPQAATQRRGKGGTTVRSFRYALDDETWSLQIARCPKLRPLHELEVMLDQLHMSNLVIGLDARNRFWTRPLLSRTGRCQPSTSGNVMALAKWARALVRAELGLAIVVLDYSAQEFAIAAGLSGDPNMIAAYRRGDVHMETAIVMGLVPPEARDDPERYDGERSQAKSVNFMTNYGGSARGLAKKLNRSLREAKELLRQHRHAYPVFWRWIESVVFKAVLAGEISGRMGWKLRLRHGEINPRSLMNFKMQCNGSEMLRAALARMALCGFRLCGSSHDSIMFLVPAEQLDQEVGRAIAIMERTSLSFTNGIRVRVSKNIIMPGQRMLSSKVAPMWNTLLELLGQIEAAELQKAAAD